MAALKRFLMLLLVGIVGSIFLFHQWNMSQDNRAGRIYDTQEWRKQLLREMCNADSYTFSKWRHRLEDISSSDLKNLIVNHNHRVIYCYIPKVGCTNWKKVMFALKESELHHNIMSISGDLVHNPNLFNLLNSIPMTEMKAKLRNYTTFLFVRDPFVRLISLFRNKFLERNQEFYQNFARHILRQYGNQPNPPQTVDEAFASGRQISFYNFIQYLVDPQTGKMPFEPHWRLMYQMCHPCAIQYDFVGHLETLEEDAEHLLKILKLENIKFPPPYANMTTAGSVLDWFRAVPLEDRRKLYQIYKEDFRLFGYPKPAELLDD